MSGKIINLTGKTIFVLEESGRINQIIPRDGMGRNEFLSRCLTIRHEYENMGTVAGISVRRMIIKVGSPITNLNKQNIYIVPTTSAIEIFTAFSYIDNIYVPETSIRTGNTTTKLSHKKIYGIDKCEGFIYNAGCSTDINEVREYKRECSKDNIYLCFGLIPLEQYVWSTYYGVDNMDACVLKTQSFMNTNYSHHYSGKAELINTIQYNIPISSHDEDNDEYSAVTLPAYDTENGSSLIKRLYSDKTFPINKTIMGIPLYNIMSAKKSFPEPKDGVIYVLDSRMSAYMTAADQSRTDILYVPATNFIAPNAEWVHSKKGCRKIIINTVKSLEVKPIFVSNDNIDLYMLFNDNETERHFTKVVLKELTKRGLIEIDYNKHKIIIHHKYMGCDDLITMSKMYARSIHNKYKYLEEIDNTRVLDNILNKLGFADNHVVTGKDYYLKSYDTSHLACVSHFTINNAAMRDVINEFIDDGYIIKTDDTLDARKYHFINKQFIKDIYKVYDDKIDEAKNGNQRFNSHAILLDIFKTYEIDAIYNGKDTDSGVKDDFDKIMSVSRAFTNACKYKELARDERKAESDILEDSPFPYEPIRDDDTDEGIDE